MLPAWLLLKFADVPITGAEVAGMILRRTYSRDLLMAYLVSYKAELGFSLVQLEAHALAGGRAKDVVQAAALLKNNGCEFSPVALLAQDLSGGSLIPLVEAYIKQRAADHDLQFAEIIQRHNEGEDVLGSMAGGTFSALRALPGWVLRAEYGPAAISDIKITAAGLPKTGRFFVRRPNATQWIEVSGGDIPER